MRRLVKVIAALLDYPERELQAHLPELREAVGTECRGVAGAEAVARFLEQVAELDLLRWQGEYVDTFDRSRARSLYLFEHVHGESRARGPAMVELGRLYARHGYRLSRRDLPDYLPAFLEFLSLLEWEEAAGWLEGVGDLLRSIHARLAADENRYALLFEALAGTAGETVCARPRDDTPEALDRAWAEAPVTFAVPQDGCEGCRSFAPDVDQVRDLQGRDD